MLDETSLSSNRSSQLGCMFMQLGCNYTLRVHCHAAKASAKTVTLLQVWRGNLGRRQAQHRRAAVATLASFAPCFQAVLLRRRLQREHQRRMRAAACIQRFVRGHQARTQLARQHAAAQLLQARVRGLLIRRHSDPQVRRTSVRPMS